MKPWNHLFQRGLLKLGVHGKLAVAPPGNLEEIIISPNFFFNLNMHFKSISVDKNVY